MDHRTIPVNRTQVNKIGALVPPDVMQKLRRMYTLNSYQTFFYKYVFVMLGDDAPDWLSQLVEEYGSTARTRPYLHQAYMYALLFPEIPNACGVCNRATHFSPSSSRWQITCQHHLLQGQRPRRSQLQTHA